MTIDILRKPGTVDEQLSEEARAAVAAFRSLQPTLNSYAQAMTRRSDVRVDMAAQDNGSTDGTRIFFRPPIELGDNTPHERSICSRRREDGAMQCKACRIREAVMVTIFHEIGHICFDSFKPTTDADKRKAIEFALKSVNSAYADRIRRRIDEAPVYKTKDYINLVSLINPFLPFLLNCLEDARVNRELFKVKPGLRHAFQVDENRIFAEGYEVQEGGVTKTIHWHEAPLNNQVMIGVYCKAAGYDYSEWFHSKVVGALDDAEVTSLVSRMDFVQNAQQVYDLSFRVFARLRELGFLATQEDPDPQPEPEENDEAPALDDPAPQEADPTDSDEPSSEGASPDQGGEDEADEDEVPSVESNGCGEHDSSGSSGEAQPGEAGEDSPQGEGDSVDEQDNDPAGDEGLRDGQAEPSDVDQSDGEESEGNPGNAGRLDESDSDQSGEDSTEGEDSAEFGADGSPSTGGSEGEQEDELDTEPGGIQGTGEVDSTGVPEDDDAGSTSSGTSHAGTGSHSDESSSDPGDQDSDADGDEQEWGDSEDRDSGDEDPLDSGADDGYGGTTGTESDTPPMGTPEELEPMLLKWNQHEEKPKSAGEVKAEEAVDQAIIQGIYFTTPSQTVFGVREHRYGVPILCEHTSCVTSHNYSIGWEESYWARKIGQNADLLVAEAILQPALIATRRAFSDNRRGRTDPNKKSGRVAPRALGKRAWNDDPRLFQKQTRPGRKDYSVTIGMDISGSTIGLNLALEKRAVFAQAELLNRAGVPFEIYAQSGESHDHLKRGFKEPVDMDVFIVKELHEPWGDEQKERLANLRHVNINLDGHFLEYLRKKTTLHRTTDRIILYYSDGKMPAANYKEELEILKREIKLCETSGVTLLGVGIRTDSPRAHGLDTVQVDSDEDLSQVVAHLGKRISARLHR
jgi:hypothetical protein